MYGVTGTERGKQLKEDATKILKFAGDVKDLKTTNDVVSSAQQFLDSFGAKYVNSSAAEAAGFTPLVDETRLLWDELISSSDGQAMQEKGLAVLDEWKRYGASEDGQRLLDAMSKVLAETGTSLLSTVAAKTSQTSAPEAHAEATAIGDKVEASLAKSDEVKTLISKGKEFLASKEATDMLQQKTTQAHAIVQEIRKSDIGLELLKHGNVLLDDLKDMKADSVVEQAKRYAATRSSLRPSVVATN